MRRTWNVCKLIETCLSLSQDLFKFFLTFLKIYLFNNIFFFLCTLELMSMPHIIIHIIVHIIAPQAFPLEGSLHTFFFFFFLENHPILLLHRVCALFGNTQRKNPKVCRNSRFETFIFILNVGDKDSNNGPNLFTGDIDRLLQGCHLHTTRNISDLFFARRLLSFQAGKYTP